MQARRGLALVLSSLPESRRLMGAHRGPILDLSSDPAGPGRAWAAAFAPYFTVAPIEADLVPGTLTRHRLGALTLIGMAAPAQVLQRTPEMAAGQDRDDLLFLFWLDGKARVSWPGGASASGRLQGVLLDLARPAVVDAVPVRATGLVLPRALVADQVPHLAALHGAVLDTASDPVSRLFFTSVQELAETAPAATDDRIPRVTRAVATLCGAALRRLVPRSTASRRDASFGLRRSARSSAGIATAPAPSGPSAQAAPEDGSRADAIRRFVQAELGSPDLSVEAVAERFGLSRAGLYRLFAGEGGVQRFIREQRLARAMAMLARPHGGGRRRVSAVAHACGFTDGKTFSRAFKRRFGQLPSAVVPALPLPDEAAPAPPRRLAEIAA